MKRTAAARLLILVLIVGAVLSLPGVLLAAVSAPAPGCSHCRGAGPGLASGCCCCGPDLPGHCGASGPAGGPACRCPSGSGPALTSKVFTGAPTWQASSYLFARVIFAVQLFPPSIFHPPESQV